MIKKHFKIISTILLLISFAVVLVGAEYLKLDGLMMYSRFTAFTAVCIWLRLIDE